MEIGIVAYEMEGEKTGVGRYLEGLLSGLSELDARHTYRLFFKGEPFEHVVFEDRRFVPVFDTRPEARPILWEQLRLPRLLRRDELDLVFSPAYALPRGVDVPSMVTVHDLSFERLGSEFDFKERWRRRLLARSAARRAARVLADTGTIARELERAYDLPAEKIGIVPLGVDSKFAARPENDQAANTLRLEHGVLAPYVLFLGSILPRRHVDLVVETFAAVAAEHPELRLVLAGQNRLREPEELERWIGASGQGERITRIEYVDESALVTLYRRAELSFYLSSYEGYGLPPLESLAAGTPAIVGSGLALDDLWPDYPYRCSHLDAETVIDVTRRALADGDARRHLGTDGAGRMAKLTWRRSAELFLAEIRKAVG